ncbi:hypothetical protein Patl1_11821 [Pistacia atlantica]|uniref:Uncharacterized protein n=1 Tax=Pistacia atlantica TaxID=434234 RepID=A0ACC1A5E1_9ROSI|nr:hypothetical protein Patl1_11821 [Pistacia atlantica]
MFGQMDPLYLSEVRKSSLSISMVSSNSSQTCTPTSSLVFVLHLWVIFGQTCRKSQFDFEERSQKQRLFQFRFLFFLFQFLFFAVDFHWCESIVTRQRRLL